MQLVRTTSQIWDGHIYNAITRLLPRVTVGEITAIRTLHHRFQGKTTTLRTRAKHRVPFRQLPPGRCLLLNQDITTMCRQPGSCQSSHQNRSGGGRARNWLSVGQSFSPECHQDVGSEHRRVEYSLLTSHVRLGFSVGEFQPCQRDWNTIVLVLNEPMIR